MLVIGLTGSIAMGKSEAVKMCREWGLPVFDADAEVHRLYDSPEGAALIAPFVPEATQSGRVDRKIVTEAVLKDSTLLSRLETKVHAEIRRRREIFLDEARKAGHRAAILDVPLLFETGGEKTVGKVIVISARPELQRARALSRPGMTEERLAMILARQMPDAQKRLKADAVIENNSTLAEMKNSLFKVLQDWKALPHA
ncbi:MAG: dephospho-CoA kinase [Alphaproteobacteria bacterium]|nr:dephospho-CoA kinase [Alphaproteobacteria bacterium]